MRFFVLMLVIGCLNQSSLLVAVEPLPSWNDSPSKAAIVKFVERVTDENSPDFVPVEKRIAVSDNDGTLWSEKPLYFQFLFAADRVKAISSSHPEWKNEQPYKAVIENDQATINKFGAPEILKVMAASHAEMTTDEYAGIVRDWIRTAKHPQKNVLYTQLVYQPMLEVLNYLREKGFKVFIVSGGGVDFVRVWSEEVYGIPPERVIGSSIRVKYEERDGKPVLMRFSDIDFIDDGEGKPVGIHKFIGRAPVMAFGNSDGDFAMMKWTDRNKNTLKVLLHHTDAVREFAYDRDSNIGRFDKALDFAREHNWTLIDMKQDWKQVYPPNPARKE